MEHRWGKRVAVDIPIQVTALQPLHIQRGRLANVSVSGALILVDVPVRQFSLIRVVPQFPQGTRDIAIDAYVARAVAFGIGVEWCEFAPNMVAELLRMAGNGGEPTAAPDR